MKMLARRLALATLLSSAILAAHADNTPQALPYAQNWTDTALIATNDSWSGIPGVVGYRGDAITGGTGVDPQTLLGEGTVVVNVIANQTNPNTLSTGGVAEFQLADPVVALNGSGTADAPYLLINLDTSGQSGINVAYTLRDLDGSIDNAVQPVALQYRIGNSGNFTNVAAGFVADATTGPSLATLVTPVSALLPAAVDNQPLVQVRIITGNAVGNDEWVGIDDIAIAAEAGPTVLSINDTSVDEGDSGTTPLFFTFSLSKPADAGGVSIEYSTADGSATAGSDYTAATSTVVIPEGQTSVSISIDALGDTTPESDESFVVDIVNASGASVGDAQGVGNIRNDDFVIIPIHDIQGTGATSPLANQLVATTGIVTGRKGNGFFLQASDGEADLDPATSEGVFVFTGGVPSANAAVGNRVRVRGTVFEFVPPSDPFQPPLTEIGGSPIVTLLTTGNALPAPIPLTADDPAVQSGQLEALEGMRVTVPSFTVAAPTDGNTNEPNATGTTNGIFHGVVTGIARPFREPGIPALDPIPGGGSAPPIPRWDSNPELLTVDSDTLGGAAFKLDVAAGTVITGLTGPLDFGFRRYTIHRDPNVAIDITSVAPRAARTPTSDEFTVAGYNLERFFDTINDPAVDEVVLTPAAYERRLGKASLGIRDALHAPDILAVVEMESLGVLQTLAQRINSDAVAAGQPDPQYAAYLQEGNDIGGIDVGFLVKTTEAAPGIARVEVQAVTQIGKDATWIEPDGDTATLNDRPPLQLDAVIHYADGRAFPITVIAVHQRSLRGAETDDDAGDRIRRKRQRQAEFLATLIDDLQTANPERRIVTLGDFNAFAFNDGLVDAMNIVTGTPTPDEQTAVAGDGIDLVDPDLVNLGELAPAAERYSFVFDGNAQTLDHVLVNEELIVSSYDASIDHARINGDFPENMRNDAASPARLSDHDPVIAYFHPRRTADLAVSATASSATVHVDQSIGFNVTLSNLGPDAAEFPGIGFAIAAELPTLAVTAPAGWNCDAPIIENGSTSVACAATTLAFGDSAAFALNAVATHAQVGTQVTLAVAATAQSLDPATGNNQATASVNVVAEADLSVSLGGPVKKLHYGYTEVFPLTVRNVGPDSAWQPRVTLRGDAPAANLAIAAPAGWQCAVTDDGGDFEASCVYAGAFAAGASQRFDFEIVIPSRPDSTQFLHLRADVGASTPEPNSANNTATYSNRIIGVP